MNPRYKLLTLFFSLAVVLFTIVMLKGALKSPTNCPEGMVGVPSGRVHVVYSGERWGGTVVKKVRIKHFCIDKYEASQPDATDVSMGSWDGIAPPPPARSVKGVIPWSQIPWTKAKIACQKAGKRLPSLAEWQMAFSGFSGMTWPWGNKWQPGTCYADMNLGSHPTGGCCFTIPASEGGPFETCDMVGNVSEWVDEYWDKKCFGDMQVMIAGGPSHYPHFQENTQSPNQRSGCWDWVRYSLMRSGLHFHPSNDQGYSDDGFRCVSSPG